MATPSNKSPALEQDLTKMFGHDLRESISANKCIPPPIGCGGDASQFRDELSTKEFTISGLCQACQDKVFGADEEGGSAMWTLEDALPLLRELETECNEWGYFTALAGSVLYRGWSDNDLDIHLYEREGEGSHKSDAAFVWFAQRGWHFTLCGDPLAYHSDVTVFEAEHDKRKINLFFTQLISVESPE